MGEVQSRKLFIKIFYILYKMNNIRSIKNLNINDKAKTKEQYEIGTFM